MLDKPISYITQIYTLISIIFLLKSSYIKMVSLKPVVLIPFIVISKFLKGYSKAKCIAQAYSRVLQYVKGLVQRCQVEIQVRLSEYQIEKETEFLAAYFNNL